MEYYYAKGRQPVGPLSREDFEGLAARGAVSPDTLVWRTGLPDWRSLKSLDAVVEVEDLALAAKAVAIEAAPAASSEIRLPVRAPESGPAPVPLPAVLPPAFPARLGAKLVDAALLALLTLLAIYGASEWAASQSLLLSEGWKKIACVLLPLVTVPLLYNTLFIALFGATPGKFAARFRIVDNRGQRPGAGRALVRALFEYISLFVVFAGYLAAARHPQRLAWHDRAAGTRAVTTRNDC
jgi:uncharacterized RDD family membrane protein YckC